MEEKERNYTIEIKHVNGYKVISHIPIFTPEEEEAKMQEIASGLYKLFYNECNTIDTKVK